MRFAYVLNPAARGGRSGRGWPALAGLLDAAGIGGPTYATERAGDAERLARQAAADGADVVVTVGGDGTIHEAVNGLAGTGAALGVLPLGTGNDFAHALGMPDRLPDAVALLAATPPRPVDVVDVRWETAGADGPVWHARRYANCLGVGFDAMAAHHAGRFKWLGGRAAYLAAVLQALYEIRAPGIEARVTVGEGSGARVLHDGPLFLCEVGNGHSVGGGFLLTPDARPDDGRVGVCVIRNLPTLRALRLLPTAFSGAHVRHPEVTVAEASAVRVAARGFVLPVHADGEALATKARTLDVRLVAGGLHAVMPRAADAPPTVG